jgi:hypothetical protein
MTSQQATTTLWRPTGPKELDLVRELNWRAWPPRLPEQPIFYPVLNEDYAIRIARDWNVKHDGAGFVTRFEVESEFLSRYPIQQAGGRTILELWVPAEELDDFNAHIVGEIQVVHEFRRGGEATGPVRRVPLLHRGHVRPPGADRVADGHGHPHRRQHAEVAPLPPGGTPPLPTRPERARTARQRRRPRGTARPLAGCSLQRRGTRT